MKIAILDDDPELLESVSRLLNEAGHRCFCFDRGEALIQTLRSSHFDLFVLDWNLPDRSGISVIEWIRNRIGDNVPVLLLTSRSLEEDVIAGLEAGADDFISKPFQPALLRARVQALGRRLRIGSDGETPERYGNIEFDLHRRIVSREGDEIPLTAKEFQLALLLFHNLDRALSRQYILETIWGLRADIPTRTLDSHITRVRSKLSLRPGNGFKLTSLYGYGYRLEGVGQER
ncbi:MAG: response regulator transcription factor [Sphingomonadales bacterium]|nr:response regulator transcription factor [Sphingomonadales bacterium]MBL0115685.1 response regulator transcription factor [Sphingomonadales bacterium]